MLCIKATTLLFTSQYLPNIFITSLIDAFWKASPVQHLTTLLCFRSLVDTTWTKLFMFFFFWEAYFHIKQWTMVRMQEGLVRPVRRDIFVLKLKALSVSFTLCLGVCQVFVAGSQIRLVNGEWPRRSPALRCLPFPLVKFRCIRIFLFLVRRCWD